MDDSRNPDSIGGSQTAPVLTGGGTDSRKRLEVAELRPVSWVP